MEFDYLVSMISFLVPAGLAAMLGLILSVGVMVLSVMGKRVPPVLAVSGSAIAAFGCGALAFHSSLSWGDADPLLAQVALVESTMTRAVAIFLVAGVTLPLSLALAVEGARHQPREPKRAAGTAVGVALVIAVMVASAILVEVNDMFTYIRALGYAVIGLAATMAMLSGKASEGNGADVGAAASVLFAIVVVVGEASERGLAKLLLVQRLGDRVLEERGVLVSTYMERVDPEVVWMYAVMTLAISVGFWGVFWAAKQGGRRGLGAGAAGLWLVALLFLWVAGDPGVDTMIEIAVRLP